MTDTPIPGIVIHCSYTPPEMDIGAAEIRRWHVEGNGWRDIGYHFVVRRDGTVETGRPVGQSGAHAKGHNDKIGVCLVGGKAGEGSQPCNFTRTQWRSLDLLLDQLMAEHDIAAEDVIGHNEVSSKDCPTFDVRAYIDVRAYMGG